MEKNILIFQNFKSINNEMKRQKLLYACEKKCYFTSRRYFFLLNINF